MVSQTLTCAATVECAIESNPITLHLGEAVIRLEIQTIIIERVIHQTPFVNNYSPKSIIKNIYRDTDIVRGPPSFVTSSAFVSSFLVVVSSLTTPVNHHFIQHSEAL